MDLPTATYHGAGENKCEPTDPDALRTLFAVFACVLSAWFPTVAGTDSRLWLSRFVSQRDYFRQDQEEIISTPIDIARRLPDDILRLAGYCESLTNRTEGIRQPRSHPPLGSPADKAVGGVGYVEDHQSPVEFLHGQTGLGMFGPSAVKVVL
jgi:hypothetical protein